jgi:hypothetical protein
MAGNVMKIGNCSHCHGSGWVCERHPTVVWDEDLGCTCGDGKPCSCNTADQPDIRAVIIEPDVTWH